MTSELRAAAERLRRCKTESWKVVYGFPDPGPTFNQSQADMEATFVAMERDEKMLADDWLATHRADDAEPITVETWTELFGDKKEIKSDIGVRLTFSGVNGVASTSCVWLNGEILWLESHPKAYITDRRQLRDLLAALGVTKEGV